MIGLIFLLVVLALAGSILWASFIIVQQQESVIIEKFGKFNRVLQPGLHFKIPVIEQAVYAAELRVKQIVMEIESKTNDNAFVNVTATVQYRISPDKVADSYYELEEPEAQIKSYVSDIVRSSLSVLDLNESFVSKDKIAKDIESALTEKMDSYGFKIVNTLVTNIAPDEQVKESMNSITAARNTKEAAKETADAKKIQLVREAEGEAEAKRLRGRGIADERKEIIDGLAIQLETLKARGLDVQEAQIMLYVGQHYDSLTSVAKNSNTNTLLMPTGPQSVNDLTEQLINAGLVTNSMNHNKD